MAETFSNGEIVKVKFDDGTPDVYAKVLRVIENGVDDTLYQVWQTENTEEYVDGEAGWYSRYYAHELVKIEQPTDEPVVIETKTQVKEETVNEIPQNVIEALAQARETGAYNMFDRRGVIEVVSMIDDEASVWLQLNKARYMDALNAMGEYISKPKPPAPQPAATQDKRADNGESSEVARGEYAVGDYVMFGTADGDMAGGVITSIVDGEFTIDEGNGVTYMRRHYHINRKIDRTPKVSPFNVGDTVRYIGTSKKLTGLTGEVVSVDGTSSHVRFGHRPRSFNLGNSLLELVARATSEPAAAQTVDVELGRALAEWSHAAANEAGTGDVKITTALDTLVALVTDQYDVNPLAVKANKALDAVGVELDAKDATIARLEAERDSLRAALKEVLSIRYIIEPMEKMSSRYRIRDNTRLNYFQQYAVVSDSWTLEDAQKEVIRLMKEGLTKLTN